MLARLMLVAVVAVAAAADTDMSLERHGKTLSKAVTKKPALALEKMEPAAPAKPFFWPWVRKHSSNAWVVGGGVDAPRRRPLNCLRG